MATIKPTLSSCITNNCSKITLKDNTGLWNSTTGTQKWSNTQVVGGLTLSDIVSATVTIVNTDTETEYEFILKDNNVNLYPTEASNEFSFTPFNWSNIDGIYSITYEVVVDSPDVSIVYTDKILITCAAEKCIQDQWKKYFTDCSCDGNKEIYTKALEMESMLKGIQAEFICNEDQKAIKILSILNKICIQNNCGCH